MNVGLFFGTFDPIHVGHEKIAKYFLERYFDQIWFVITPLNPDKVNEKLTDPYIRLDMAKEYCLNHKNFKYCDIEFKLQKPNYTADTLDELKNQFPDLKFSIIMGEDNLVGLEKWKNYKSILKGKIYVYPRNIKNLSNTVLKNHKSIVYSDAPLMKISSTKIRERIKNKENYLSLIPDEIFKFILRSDLYK